MRELSSCDFCGGDAVGVYEPLPDDYADQRRVALCAHCRETLDAVLAPLHDASPGGPVEARDGRATPTESGTAHPTVTVTPAEGGDGADAGDGGPPAGTVEADADAGDGSADAGDESGAAAGDGSADDADQRGEADTETPRPRGYGQVLRLVENREEVLAREELVALATGAYDVDASVVESILDAAVENGDLAEREDGLVPT